MQCMEFAAWRKTSARMARNWSISPRTLGTTPDPVIAKGPGLDRMTGARMEKPTRASSTPPSSLDAEFSRTAPEPKPASPSQPPAAASKDGARFVGSAMKALFESSDVSIKRGDETRVMSRAQETLEELQRRYPGALPPASPQSDSVRPPIPSEPPRPRVDAVLWIVLAVGLFAIAGWMIASGLH
jgi:hypothetical protein